MTFESSLKWSEHIYGTGGLISSLNQRLFFIRRLKNTIGQTALLKISHGLFLSKLRYGLQLLGCVRWSDSDPSNKELEDIQKCQNKLLRALNGSRISDQISNKSMLVKFKILSVNQMNAQIKLSEMWKSINIENYPLKTELLEMQVDVLAYIQCEKSHKSHCGLSTYLKTKYNHNYLSIKARKLVTALCRYLNITYS